MSFFNLETDDIENCETIQPHARLKVSFMICSHFFSNAVQSLTLHITGRNSAAFNVAIQLPNPLFETFMENVLLYPKRNVGLVSRSVHTSNLLNVFHASASKPILFISEGVSLG